MLRSRSLFLIAGSLVRLCAAQTLEWLPDQVNSTMCIWDSPRAAVIRDTLYIDGGYLWWQPGMADGTYGGLMADGNPTGLVYTFNFGTPFNTSQNISSIFNTISKASGGGLANNVGPQYYDGAMFANDYEWITYGGLLGETDAFDPPEQDAIAIYEAFPTIPRTFAPGYKRARLSEGTTRYITNGASVSVPSENLGFYFGGLRSRSSGPIFYSPGPRNSSSRAEIQSLTLIAVNMTVQSEETWRNDTLPSTVPGRANAEIVWVPVSEKGILVAIGGVIFPSFANINQTNNASATAESENISPSFMSTISVYDIETRVWYEQDAPGGPGALTQGCTVLASAQDGSSHNIYWYGGFDGLHPTEDFSDEVWVLSVPSFKWIKLSSGSPSHGRAGHRCLKPYPDQMLVIGGYSSLGGSTLNCVEGGIIQIFNLSSAEWITSYDPAKWSNYTIPAAIYPMIGGSPTGSATQTSPSPSGFSNSSLSALFRAPYDTSKVKTWYPYQATETSTNNRTTLLPTPVPGKSSTPSYLAPVLGVVLGLFFITLVIIAFLLWRRRRFLKSNQTATQSEAGTMDNRRWVTSWLNRTPQDVKAPTVTSDETPTSAYDDDQRTDYAMPPEMGGRQVHELDDTSRPVELHDTGFIPMTQLNGHHKDIKLTSSPSVTSHTSTVSRVSQNSRPGISPVHADSPPLSHSSQVGNEDERIVSGMSAVSENERGHLRGISETSVSTDGGIYATPIERFGSGAVQQERPNVVSPLTPPSAVREGHDYIGSGGSSSQRRKSNFSEGLDEVERQ